MATLIEQIKATSDELEHDKSIARRDADPAVIAARKRLANLTADYNDLWSIRSEQIRQRLLVETGGLGSGESTVTLRRKIEALEAKKNNLVQMLTKYDVQNQQSSTDTLKATFLREEINSLTGNIRHGRAEARAVEVRELERSSSASSCKTRYHSPRSPRSTSATGTWRSCPWRCCSP